MSMYPKTSEWANYGFVLKNHNFMPTTLGVWISADHVLTIRFRHATSFKENLELVGNEKTLSFKSIDEFDTHLSILGIIEL